jgi:curved DNA-binding protein CbpA
MSNEFDPKKIINFEKDYYIILGIDKNDLPKAQDRQNKIVISQTIEKAFRKMARKCHPDFGGSKESFLDLVRARRILEDPVLRKIYDQGYFEEFSISNSNSNSGFDVNWDKIGNYRKGSPEDTTGFSLFLQISENKNELGLTPAFFPTLEEHNYEWDWVVNEKKVKLALSIVNDESEVLRLTNGEDIDNSLPFKIYICIPRTSLVIKRNNNVVLDPNGKVLQNADIQSVSYNDYNLLETTNLETAKNYINDNFGQDLKNFIEGKLKPQNVSANETKWLDSNQIRKIDKEKLSEILNLRSFEYNVDEKAADFLDKIKVKKITKVSEDKPELPF